MDQIRKILMYVCVASISLFTLLPSLSAYEGTIILCYHDVPKNVHLDNFGADQKSFINAIEYFKAHGYTFISLSDLIEAKNIDKDLPEKTILLTFDDAYQSFYKFVYPMLTEYKIPSTLAVVTSWIDGEKPDSVKHDLMSWDQIREVAESPYVDVVSHSHDLHKGIVYNPQGNKLAAAVNRKYDAQTKNYEDMDTYMNRVENDLKRSKMILEEKTGQIVRAIAWPYGAYNEMTAKKSKELGFEIQFTLNDKIVMENQFDQINRFLVHKNPTIDSLRKDLKLIPELYRQKRIVQVDLDMIYDPDPAQTERNLDAFLDRIKQMRVTTVYLQAFSDNEGTGNISTVYFPNRLLPVKQDLFSRVAHQLKSRAEVEVYAWMPMLSIDLPESLANDDLYVRQYSDGKTEITSSWYKRLSPFSLQVKDMLTKLYEDLAVYSSIDGIVFQDDGYLNEEEDFHSAAVGHYKRITGTSEIIAPDQLSFKQKEEWIKLKIRTLNELSEHLFAVATRYRPEIRSARTLYAPVVFDESAKERFAQDYKESLALYDYVVIMAYPYLEEVKHPKKWFKKLVAIVKKYPDGIDKTVFKIQTYHWKDKKWVSDKELSSWLKVLVSSGARHLAYYPDDYFKNHPDADIIREMMSVEDFPFERDWK